MKNRLIIFSFFFCVQCYLFGSSEKDLYLFNIDKALNASGFDQQFEVVKHPNLRKEVTDLFLQIYENEKAHPDFIQCVTAQDSLFYAYQVIAKELYRKLYGSPKEDFEFLRFPTQNLLKSREEFFSQYPSLLIISQEYLAKGLETTLDKLDETFEAYKLEEEEEYLRISQGEPESSHELENEKDDWEDKLQFSLNDTYPDVSKELISVNFTMETYLPLDSALSVFLSGNSVSLTSLSKD